MITQTLGSYKKELKLIQTILGIFKISAMEILAEAVGDMRVFIDQKSFISWCWLCAASKQSNGKHKSVKIGKGGTYLKPIFLQSADAAIKTDPYSREKYLAIKSRRGSNRARIAIDRKLMIAVHNVFLRGEHRILLTRKKQNPCQS